MTHSQPIAQVAIVLSALLLSTSPALADEPVDTVFLKKGGRLRGTVMEEDPRAGVTIQLADGTTRKLKRAEVESVQYAAPTAAAPAAAAAPAPARPAARPAYSPSGYAQPGGPPSGATESPPSEPVGPLGEDAEGRYDRLAGSGVYAFAEIGFGYARAMKASPAPRDLDGLGLSGTAGVGLTIGSAVALGLGAFFSPILTPEFGPGGAVGVLFAVYPVPQTGLNMSLLAGGGGAGGGSGLNGRYGGPGPGFSFGLGYDFLERKGWHPTLGIRTNYLAMMRSPGSQTFLDHFVSVSFTGGISFH